MGKKSWGPGVGIRSVETYHGLPFYGAPEGELYFCKDMNAFVTWDKDVKDWKIINEGTSAIENPVDEHNDRRGAIMAQRARRSR